MSELVTVKLSDSIEHAGDQITEINIRPVCGADLNKCGYPVMITDGGNSIPIPAHISALIVRCGGVPPSVVGKFSMKDFNACMGVIMGFLEEEEAG